ncbi:alpha/beta fold hydrolase [Colwellia sp. MB02u-9]|uniref:alpha/beta fold hydrolase n=1 Tax=Colwellia sp. MB02u-9 TaxID=2759823 RepID=UPI0015F3A14D|nr:alpha/beta fold hydrolase [Colwellia sp. MB02u-9]MBA6295681.1 alpha/beta fold hydrolase [Colwellia sp. MB02u-9]
MNDIQNNIQSATKEYVILLHGLARSAHSMDKMAQRLTEQGYQVLNIDYPSRAYSIEQLAEQTISDALAQCHNMPVSFVTHSMGGILVRQFLSHHSIKNLNKVVMLGPPNKGTEIVDKLGNLPGFHLVNGDAGMQLGTGALSVPNQLGKANFDVGIIAGTQSINLLLSTLIPDADDGKVSVESTKIDGMNDHIEIPTSHVFMMRNDAVIAQVISYLKQGKFNR